MAYNPNLDHLRILQLAKAELFGASASLTADQCVALINEAARRFVAAGEADAGLVAKSGGNHGTGADGQGYSVDIILYRDSAVYVDCLRDAGDSTAGTAGAAVPVWPTPKPGEITEWRPPFGSPTGPEPPEPPVPEPEPELPFEEILNALEAQLAVLEHQLAVQQEVLKAVDELEGQVTDLRKRLDQPFNVKLSWR